MSESSGDQQETQRVTLGTVILFTSDMQRLADFYARGLGIGPPNQTSPGHLGWHLGAAGAYFGIDEASWAEQNREFKGGATTWFTVDDLEATYSRFINQLGATVRSEPKRIPWGAFLAFVYDPDSNIVGLVARE